MDPRSLKFVFDGWGGHNLSLRRAIEPRNREELGWRPLPDLPSVGEVVAHLAFARIIWFARMGVPQSGELRDRFAHWRGSGGEWKDPGLCADALRLLELLDGTWAMVDALLNDWTVEDLPPTYRHSSQDVDRAISRQWTIWRVLSHDIHHGGQISEMLYQQGIEIDELGDQGGHLIEPPLWPG